LKEIQVMQGLRYSQALQVDHPHSNWVEGSYLKDGLFGLFGLLPWITLPSFCDRRQDVKLLNPQWSY